jgi:hypothetical protein
MWIRHVDIARHRGLRFPGRRKEWNVMTRYAKCLSSFVTPAIVALWAATAMSPLAADRPTLNGQAGSPVLLADREIIIHGGCPYNLDKVCLRDRHGRLHRCHCAS